MKILYHHRVAARDGMDVHITELVAAFRALGHEVIMVGPERGGDTSFGKGGELVNWVRRLLPKAVGEVLEIFYDRLAFRRLERAYLTHHPDVLYERNNLFLSAGKRLKEKYHVPFLLEVNSPLADEREAHGGLALTGFAHRQEGEVWRAADYAFPVSHVLATYLVDAGVAREHIQVIPNGVNRDMFHAGVEGGPVRERYGLEGTVVLGFVGFVRDWHGLDHVIEAMAARDAPDNLQLLVVGDGPARQALEAQAERLGLGARVHFTGVVARIDMASHIAAFDIALQPAVTPYASPLKLFEYMAMGKAIIAPDEANMREILTDGVDAVLSDMSRFFSSPAASLCTEIAERERLGTNALQTLESRGFLWRENGRRVLDVLANDTASVNHPPDLTSKG